MRRIDYAKAWVDRLDPSRLSTPTMAWVLTGQLVLSPYPVLAFYLPLIARRYNVASLLMLGIWHVTVLAMVIAWYMRSPGHETWARTFLMLLIALSGIFWVCIYVVAIAVNSMKLSL
jgi:hypothetical protein